MLLSEFELVTFISNTICFCSPAARANHCAQEMHPLTGAELVSFVLQVPDTGESPTCRKEENWREPGTAERTKVPEKELMRKKGKKKGKKRSFWDLLKANHLTFTFPSGAVLSFHITAPLIRQNYRKWWVFWQSIDCWTQPSRAVITSWYTAWGAVGWWGF